MLNCKSQKRYELRFNWYIQNCLKTTNLFKLLNLLWRNGLMICCGFKCKCWFIQQTTLDEMLMDAQTRLEYSSFLSVCYHLGLSTYLFGKFTKNNLLFADNKWIIFIITHLSLVFNSSLEMFLIPRRFTADKNILNNWLTFMSFRFRHISGGHLLSHYI